MVVKWIICYNYVITKFCNLFSWMEAHEMVYSYNEKQKQVKLVKVPKLKGSDAQRVENSKVPKSFLNNVMKMKLNVTSA